MSTDYFLIDPSNICPHCGHNPIEPTLIGTNSFGWKFLFEGSDELNLKSGAAWLKFLEKNPQFAIKDEYDRTIALPDFLVMIGEHQKYHNREGSCGSDGYRIRNVNFW